MALALVLSLIPSAAVAHDHRVPRTVLRSPGDSRVGHPWTYEWSADAGDGTCSQLHVDGIPNYQRRPLVWRPHRKIHLRLFKRHKPTRLVIRMYRRLDNDDRPAGRSQRAEHRLRRVRLNGRLVWIAGFYGRRKARHLYLDVHAIYEDVEGCGGTQSMDLAFHLHRRVMSQGPYDWLRE